MSSVSRTFKATDTTMDSMGGRRREYAHPAVFQEMLHSYPPIGEGGLSGLPDPVDGYHNFQITNTMAGRVDVAHPPAFQNIGYSYPPFVDESVLSGLSHPVGGFHFRDLVQIVENRALLYIKTNFV